MILLINNNHIMIRIVVVYMPQESRTTVQELAEYHKKIDKHHIIVVGNFNCKIGSKINGNDNAITKLWRMLIEIVKNITDIL